MNLLMISGDRSILSGKKGAFWYALEELNRHWGRIDIITPFPGGRSAVSGQRSAFGNVFLHPSPHGLWRQPWWILKKGRELVAEHHHAVMTVHEYPPFYNGLGATWLHRATRVPFVLEVHHVVGFPESSSLSEWIGARLSRIVLPREASEAAAVRTVSASVKETLLSFRIPAEKVRVVSSFYLDASILRIRHTVKRFDVVTCARLVANKGITEVVDAMTLLPDASLLIVGDGPELPRLETHARRRGLQNRVTFPGWLASREDVAAAVQSAHVFVMNSRSEGGPRTALEAMALGMPVITTRVGVMPEIIQDNVNGLFTDGTPPDLAEKIRLLLSDAGMRERMGSAARSILNRFERKKLVGEYAGFLKKCRTGYTTLPHSRQ